MSLVGLKNLFFSQTRTPIPRHHQSKPKTHGYMYPETPDWSNVSSEPLLPPSNPESGDLEAQSRSNSKTEKANAKKGFRIDARVISDATIGLSDGLTVPFALTAGLSALGNTKVVIYGGFAELIAGAISMGLGGANLSDLTAVFEPYNIPAETLTNLTSHLTSSPKLVDFVMQFQHCESEPASSRALTSALTIAGAYFFGGLLPLIPYFFVGAEQVFQGLYISIGVMVLALFAFGYVKTCVVVGWEGGRAVRQGCFGGVQMVVVGSAAAGAAMGLVRLFNDGGV
ncbi:Protein CCC1 [Lachnellula hyalina]|uniref:Protein CCC1 n=1 Tax=Lachnellula hyalina TaxID=1316788 RepID=A0A8H8R1W1_9HELO|nr:Protein CCC1 [Lachnellula hyalina]TVY26843.1 Protein CCC1 [Lachnellula hyalina]